MNPKTYARKEPYIRGPFKKRAIAERFCWTCKRMTNKAHVRMPSK